MNLSFFSYFFGYIFKNRTRQKLIFLAILGLLISSFSLTVLQGIMGGLQTGLITRSKNVLGHGYIDLGNTDISAKQYQSLLQELERHKIKYVPELELELMIQNDSYVSPIILHGVDYTAYIPGFLEKKSKTQVVDREHIVIGSDLATALRAYYGSKVKITSPAHTDFLLAEIPRQVSTYISDFVSSELPEVDSVHGWVRLSFLQNLVRKKQVNKIRIYSNELSTIATLLEDKKYAKFHFISWEKKHSTLVWALNLETKVMLFLFTAMSILIGICITSGFLIFYNKIKVDLTSFWIMGMNKTRLFKLIYLFGQFLAIIFSLGGVILGLLFLLLIDSNSIVLMPEQFVERNIPVHFNYKQILLAFLVPYGVASFFTHYTFKMFRKGETSFLSQIKKLG